MMLATREEPGALAALPDDAADEMPTKWQDALTVAQLFAVDPAGLGGVALRADAGPIRDAWLKAVRGALPADAPVRRLPAHIQDDRLLGGIDLIATLGTGRAVLQKGVLAEADGGILLIPMAERLSPGVAGRIAGVLDRRAVVIEREGLASRVDARIGVIAFDESVTADESLPPSLTERLAFHLNLEGIPSRGLDCPSMDATAAATARARLAAVEPAPDEIVEALVATASALGIAAITAPLLALRAARAAAALAGRSRIGPEDALLAARLVLVPRARQMPPDADAVEGVDESPGDSPQPPADPEPSADAPENEEAEDDASATQRDFENIMLAAVRSAVPEGLLARLKGAASSRAPESLGHGAGTMQASLLRGRPAGVRMGPLRPGSRLALIDTLRAAAPWQPARRAGSREGAAPRRIEILPQDIRLKSFAQRRSAAIVFCVDASGSTAFHRLAEAKGAVELMLAEAYVARTHVALIVFRGRGAEILLPPTRSLSRAKALLATFPGGGGTPLAAGIDAALTTASSERAKGREPLIVMLTDGRANTGRDGVPGRKRATDEAMAASRQVAVHRVPAVFVDTSPRPRGDAADLAAAMGARYVALPYVEAAAVRDAVRAAAPGLGAGAPRGR